MQLDQTGYCQVLSISGESVNQSQPSQHQMSLLLALTVHIASQWMCFVVLKLWLPKSACELLSNNIVVSVALLRGGTDLC